MLNCTEGEDPMKSYEICLFGSACPLELLVSFGPAFTSREPSLSSQLGEDVAH